MKYLLAVAAVASTVVGFSAAASAAEGCGPGFYRGPYGHCRPMHVAPRVVERPVVVVPARRACPPGFVWAYGHCRPI